VSSSFCDIPAAESVVQFHLFHPDRLPTVVNGNMSQTEENSWSERLRSFVGLGRRPRQGMEQSASDQDNAEQTSTRATRRSSKTGEFTTFWGLVHFRTT